jgi:hypothetical protein
VEPVAPVVPEGPVAPVVPEEKGEIFRFVKSKNNVPYLNRLKFRRSATNLSLQQRQQRQQPQPHLKLHVNHQ